MVVSLLVRWVFKGPAHLHADRCFVSGTNHSANGGVKFASVKNAGGQTADENMRFGRPTGSPLVGVDTKRITMVVTADKKKCLQLFRSCRIYGPDTTVRHLIWCSENKLVDASDRFV